MEANLKIFIDRLSTYKWDWNKERNTLYNKAEGIKLTFDFETSYVRPAYPVQIVISLITDDGGVLRYGLESNMQNFDFIKWFKGIESAARERQFKARENAREYLRKRFLNF